MTFLSIIIVLVLITVIAVAFWKDIKNMSSRQTRRPKTRMKVVKTINKKEIDAQ